MDQDVLRTQIDAATAIADALVSADLSAVDGVAAAALHRRLRAVVDRLGLVTAGLVARVEAAGAWEASGGARTLPEWTARREGTSVAAARREATLGQAMSDGLPGTRAAVVAGDITLEHAQLIAQLASSSPARRAALASGGPDADEGFLLSRARVLGADHFAREARRWAGAVDAAAAEREHDRARTKQHLTISRRADGAAVQGFLTHENAALLQTALRAVQSAPTADDDRPSTERQAEALGALARLVLDRGNAGLGAQIRPHLSVHVSWETFRALRAGVDAADGPLTPGELDDGELVPASVLARIACDSEVSRIVFGPAQEVLDVGRAQRTYSGQRRRAVIARDRTCRYPGCTAAPWLCDVHHVEQWVRDGGRTSVENGILLCWHHHQLLHRTHLRVARVEGGWAFTRHDGTPLTDGFRGTGSTAGMPAASGAQGVRAASVAPALRTGAVVRTSSTPVVVLQPRSAPPPWPLPAGTPRPPGQPPASGTGLDRRADTRRPEPGTRRGAAGGASARPGTGPPGPEQGSLLVI